MDPKLYMIVNPNAGRKKAGRVWPEIQDLLDSAGLDYDFSFTRGPGHATELVNAAAGKGFNRFVAVGGDGTMNEVLNGIMNQKHFPPVDVSLGKINVGTGNDWGKTYGLKNDFKENIDRISSGAVAYQDIGLIRWENQERYFINIAGAGYDAEVVDTVNRNQAQGKGGTLTYLVNLLKCLFRYKSNPYTLVIDDKQYSGRLFSLGAGMCRFNGNGMMQLPFAEPNDGIMDITVINHISIPDILRYIPKLYNGSFVQHPSVEIYTGKKISLQTEMICRLEADGESLGNAPFHIEIIPSAIRVMV